jgi:hypothetical protein
MSSTKQNELYYARMQAWVWQAVPIILPDFYPLTSGIAMYELKYLSVRATKLLEQPTEVSSEKPALSLPYTPWIHSVWYGTGWKLPMAWFPGFQWPERLEASNN